MAERSVLRLGFTDYFGGLDEFFVSWLSRRYEIVRDDVSPDFLVFCDETFGTKNLEFDPSKVVKIFYTGENRRPWNYACEAAITFDHYDTDNHYRLPLYVIDHWVMVNKLGMPAMFMDRFNPPGIKKTGFCCFISGNGANPHRNSFFHKLNSYKQVDSFGPLFNNVGSVLPRGPEAAKHKATVLPNYKFNLCFENGEYPGYCTEKLFHALYMKTVPIYCGSSTAGLDFRPGSFVSWHDFLDDDRLLRRIVELDQDDDKYRQVYLAGQNLFGLGTNKYADVDRFLDWFGKHIYPRKKS